MAIEPTKFNWDKRDKWDGRRISGLFSCPTLKKPTGTTGTLRPGDNVSSPTRPTSSGVAGTADNGVNATFFPLVPPVPSEISELTDAEWIERHDRSGAYIRAIKGSINKPWHFDRLQEDYQRTWKAIVYSRIVDDGLPRIVAEEAAWRILREITANERATDTALKGGPHGG